MARLLGAPATRYVTRQTNYTTDIYGLVTATDTQDVNDLLCLGLTIPTFNFGLPGSDLGDTYARSTLAATSPSSPVLPRWKTALARAMAGGAPATIASIGDSLSCGSGAGSGGTTNNNGSKVKSWPTQLAARLSGIGVPASGFATFGNNLIPGGLPGLELYDPNIAIPTKTNWSASLQPISQAILNSADTTAFNFTPPESTDKIDVYYISNSGFATFTVKDGIGGSTLATPNASAGAAIAKVSITRTLSANTISIQRTGTGSSLYIVGIDTWNSTKHQVKIWNCGCYGQQSADLAGYTGAPWDPLVGLDTPKPDLVFINLGTNDKTAGVPAANFKANMQSIITARKAAGADVVLIRPHPNGTTTNDNLLPAYQTAIYDLCVQNSLIAPIDMTQRFVSYAARLALGDYFDTVHLVGQGYGDYANAIFPVVRPQ